MFAYLTIQQWAYMLTASSLRLFVLNSLQAYCHLFFFEGCTVDICDTSHLPSLWIISHGDYSSTAIAASSLRPLILNSSLIRCRLVQVYHHQPTLEDCRQQFREWSVLLLLWLLSCLQSHLSLGW
jgi:hypothetical protein